MQHHWRKLFSFFPEAIERKLYRNYFVKEHDKLQENNPEGYASNLSKQEVLKTLKKKYELKTLVETGTYLGDTLFALYPHFDKLYSIELSEHYHEKARQRFRKYPKIELIQGDSAKQISNVVASLKEPALFWLDGHYSAGLTAKGEKDTPIYEELTAVFSSSLPHVIVIDDARAFVGENDYPTIEELKHFVQKHRPNSTITIENDSIRILPA